MDTKEKYPVSSITDTKGHLDGTFVFINRYDNQPYPGIWRPPGIPLNIKDVSKEFMVTHQTAFRPDLVATVVYNNPIMAWAVCYFNNILDPFDETEGLYVGRILNIVNKEYFAR